MAGGDRTKVSHFVPQSYLTRFANERDQVFVYNKADGKTYHTHIRNVASERGFYDLPDSTLDRASDKQMPEKALAVWESRWKTTLDYVLQRAEIDRKEPITKEIKPFIAHLLSVQFLRTPLRREVVKQTYQRTAVVAEAIAKKQNIDTPEEYKFDTSEATLQLEQLDVIFNPVLGTKHAEAFLKHYWVIGKNVTDAPLYTSDSPVALRGHRGDIAIDAKGVEIVFPLNPKYLLILLERTVHHSARKYANRCVELGPNLIAYYNSLQVANSFRQVYSVDNNFEIADEICESMPHVRSKNMARVSVTSPSLE